LLEFSSASMAERRVALVIGNGAYKRVPTLPNPPSDAVAMSALLRTLGFKVLTGSNLDRDGMADRLREFSTETQGADVALFFYAGHGLSLDGKNYLLPIDANLKSELDVKLGGSIDIEVMLQQIMADAKVKLVLLDACRDNPFVSQIARSVKTRTVAVSSGLAEMKSGEGTLLAFATGPGQVALDGDKGNSPFTRALLENLGAPGLEIRLALTRVRASVSEQTNKQQLPWENTNLTGFFYMNPSAEAPSLATAAASTASPASNELELEFWRSVRDSSKPEELNAYLVRYPNGAFASIARARLAEIQVAKVDPAAGAVTTAARSTGGIDPAVRTAEASQATEDALGLDRDARRDLQRRLSALGFSTRGNSGKFDGDTRRAIKSWQSARGYTDSGFLNKLQHDALRTEIVPSSTARDDNGPRRNRSHGGGGGGGGGFPGNGSAAAGAFFGGVVRGMIGR
jgi:uncharacterized caspase-like protein